MMFKFSVRSCTWRCMYAQYPSSCRPEAEEAEGEVAAWRLATRRSCSSVRICSIISFEGGRSEPPTGRNFLSAGRLEQPIFFWLGHEVAGAGEIYLEYLSHWV